jgi:hypothetical protein
MFCTNRTLTLDAARISFVSLEPLPPVCFDSRERHNGQPMLRVWNSYLRRQRVALALTAGVVGIFGPAGPGFGQERPTPNFQRWYSGEYVLPVFTKAQIRFGSALTSGSDWSAPSPLLDPTPIGSLEAASSRLQPTNTDAASRATEPVSVGAVGGSNLLHEETAPASAPLKRRKFRRAQRRGSSLGRGVATRNEPPGHVERGIADSRRSEVDPLPRVLRLGD